ncbi:MAG: Snf7 family protein [Candidatus Helarchaeota archaeon]|nr:Snf7 family protein [Candidatus Helarchaeota archaeon]
MRKGKNLQKVITKIDVFNRNLTFQRKHLEKQSRDQFRTAKRYRLEGNNQAARLYMEHRLRFQKWAFAVDTYRLNIEGLLHQLRMAQSHHEMARTLAVIQRTLRGMAGAIQLPKLAEIMNDVNSMFQQFDLAGEFIDESIQEGTQVSTQVTDAEINEAMTELDAEIGVETGQILKTPSGKISELEDEIKKLKQGKD